MTQPDPPRTAMEASDSNDVSRSYRGDIRMRLFARTDVGQIREHNEDNFVIADLTRRTRRLPDADRSAIIGKDGALFAVCDGMGGAAAGEIASQLAVDILYERMIDVPNDGRDGRRDDLARRLVSAIEAAGLRIFQEAKVDRTRRGMGTTVTAAALLDDHLFFAQVGDSRAYLLRNGELVQLTRDQSLVNQLIEAGQLTEEEAETFEHNNIILQALGTADTVQVDLTFCELRRGDTLLICSDGLSGMVRFDEIREVVRTTPDPLDACKLLIERANQAGGHDNITVIVVHFDGEGLKPLEPHATPPKYQKYALPEAPVDNNEPTRRTVPEPPSGVPHGSGTSAPQGLSSTFAFAGSVMAPLPASAPHTSSIHAPAPPYDEEHIEIPGTHVPGWVVVALVLSVIVILAGTAFLLLR
ncbi:MAG: Stp1/IreP family PP2C-type Ser/Thr phosphatase [Myxococcota bacterium]|nr:Stp1/IreP family PP2C-type Ser/Thr phosphatase [Myxococcota bacterium]